MYYVYIINSIHSDAIYVGMTKDLKIRLHEHNYKKVNHTKKYTPWKLTWYGAFNNKLKAHSFEKYLKTGSGAAFRNKRLV
jgi:predicted GIY-YIG superfamily endonuclease